MTCFSFFKYFDAFELDVNVVNFVYYGKTRLDPYVQSDRDQNLVKSGPLQVPFRFHGVKNWPICQKVTFFAIGNWTVTKKPQSIDFHCHQIPRIVTWFPT